MLSIVTAELALHTQSLSILLLPPKTDMKNITAEDLDGDSDEPHRSLALGKECELDQSRVEDARLGFAALELLNDTPDERDVGVIAGISVGCMTITDTLSLSLLCLLGHTLRTP